MSVSFPYKMIDFKETKEMIVYTVSHLLNLISG
jgi:hypothetical protein